MPSPLNYREAGDRNAPILFFIHGWPDSADLWSEQIRHFSGRFRCVAVTLPVFSDEEKGRGCDYPQLIEQLVATIAHVRGTDDSPLILVGHDWGAFLVYLLDQRHPRLATRVITLDVGAHFKPRSFGHAIFMLSYQWWLVAAFCIGRILPFVGDAMTRWFSKFARTPRGAAVHHRMNYLYFYFWRARLFSKYRNALPVGYKPTKPLLYLYGKAKRYHFHSARWEEIVAKTVNSKVVAIEKGGHWFARERALETNAAIDSWLKSVGIS
jgi:pimeloyl-ACP methyl ester carboxylesterase